MKYIFLLSWFLLLSCAQESPEQMPIRQPRHIEVIQTWVVATGEVSTWKMITWEAFNRVIKNENNSGVSIQAPFYTWAWISMNASGKQNVIDPQTRSELMGKKLREIKDKRLEELLSERNAILEAREIWGPELSTADAELSQVVKASILSGWLLNTWSFSLVANKRIEALKRFNESKEYQDYIKNNQAKINTLTEEINKYLLPSSTSSGGQVYSSNNTSP